MRTVSPVVPCPGARPVAALVALSVALTADPAQAQAPAAAETLPEPVRVEGVDGPVPLAVPPTAPPPFVGEAQQPAAGLDVVTLRDGSVIRGTVAEVFHGQQVTIVSAAGQRHVVPWDQVADLRYAGAAEAAATPGPGRPTLHIELTRPAGGVRLYEVANHVLVAPGMHWGQYAQAQQALPICGAPCDRVIDGSRGQTYFFGGHGISPSRRFSLEEHDGPMLARVRPGKVGVLVGGILFTSMSVAPLISGTLFLALSSNDSSSSYKTRNAGAALTAVGAGMLISGIIMIALGRTRVELYRRYTGAAQRRPRAAN